MFIYFLSLFVSVKVINNTQAKHILSLAGVTGHTLADECQHRITKTMCRSTSNWVMSFHCCYLSYQTSQISGQHFWFVFGGCLDGMPIPSRPWQESYLNEDMLSLHIQIYSNSLFIKLLTLQHYIIWATESIIEYKTTIMKQQCHKPPIHNFTVGKIKLEWSLTYHHLTRSLLMSYMWYMELLAKPEI
jgi:hypothetical protein